jgi:hypothetical protein
MGISICNQKYYRSVHELPLMASYRRSAVPPVQYPRRASSFVIAAYWSYASMTGLSPKAPVLLALILNFLLCHPIFGFFRFTIVNHETICILT